MATEEEQRMRPWRRWVAGAATALVILLLLASLASFAELLGLIRLNYAETVIRNIFIVLLYIGGLIGWFQRFKRFKRAHSATIDEYISISSRAKGTAVSGCFMVIGAWVLLFLSGSVLAFQTWPDGLYYCSLVLMLVGFATIGLVTPVLWLVDMGDRQMLRYRDQHGASAAPTGMDGGTSAE